jgi:hypothetical protein
MAEDPNHRKAFDRLVAMIGDKDAPTYEDATHATIAAEPEHFPLLEEFKASLNP